MPVIAIGLAAAAAGAAAASYLVPLIISCAAGFVAIIISFVAGRAYAGQDSAKNAEELAKLHKEQLQRDKRTREDAEKIVKYTDQEVKDLLRQSKKQQDQLAGTLDHFDQNLTDASQATEKLEHAAEFIQEAANSSSLTMTALSSELERLKTELLQVNTVLYETQLALSEKDNYLKDTLQKLSDIEKKMEENNESHGAHILQLKNGLTELQHLLAQQYADASLKDTEIQSLRASISKSTATIQRLESAIARLNNKLDDSLGEKEAHFQEIRRLLDENKKLLHTIDKLSDILERQQPHDTLVQPITPHQIRLFK